MISIEALKVGQKITTNEAIQIALDLSKKGQGRVEPNPCVGAVLFNEKTNELASWGHHEFFGGPHAEVNCLKNKSSAEGLTMVVTLEPCSHTGKTPPCAKLLIEKKLSKLVYISEDPNPRVIGSGLKMLKHSGVQVEKAPDKFNQLNRRINAKFFHAFENEKSFVHLKWAQSLDGKMSFKSEKKWITSEASREHSQFLRAQSQMVIVGKQTVLSDDPSLNIRLKVGLNVRLKIGLKEEPSSNSNSDLNLEFKKNKVGVIDPDLEIENSLEGKNLLKVRDQKDIFFIASKKSSRFETIVLPKNSKGDLDLTELPKILFKNFKIQSVFVEGGAKTLGLFLEQKIYDQLSVYVAPVFFGGQETSGPTDHVDFNALSLIKNQMSVIEKEHIGNDTLFNFHKT